MPTVAALREAKKKLLAFFGVFGNNGLKFAHRWAQGKWALIEHLAGENIFAHWALICQESRPCLKNCTTFCSESSVGGILLVAHQCGWHITGHSSAEIMMCGNFVRGNCGRARREWLVVVALFVLFVLSRLPASPPGSQTPNWWLDALGWWARWGARWPSWPRWARLARWWLSPPVQWHTEYHIDSTLLLMDICQFEQAAVGCYPAVGR